MPPPIIRIGRTCRAHDASRPVAPGMGGAKRLSKAQAVYPSSRCRCAAIDGYGLWLGPTYGPVASRLLRNWALHDFAKVPPHEFDGWQILAASKADIRSSAYPARCWVRLYVGLFAGPSRPKIEQHQGDSPLRGAPTVW